MHITIKFMCLLYAFRYNLLYLFVIVVNAYNGDVS